jgi:predicted transposase/invertase (TIGR01784 family)
MILGIDPKVVYAFKHLFGREATRPILIDVLDSVLNPTSGHHIRDIELLNPFNPKEALNDQLSVLDIKARDQAGRQFNIEMQMLALRYYEQRILSYWAKLHQQQLHEGHDYQELKPTISISFLDHVLFPDVPNDHLHFRLWETSPHFPLTDDLEFHLFELPKFTKSDAELSGGPDKWLSLLRYMEKMDTEALPAALQQEPWILRAVEELKMLAQNDVERERYEARRKAQLDFNTAVKAARMEGRTEGRAEGEMIGRIHLCEQLLQRPLTPTEQLAGRSLEDLIQLVNTLQAQVLKE